MDRMPPSRRLARLEWLRMLAGKLDADAFTADERADAQACLLGGIAPDVQGALPLRGARDA